MEHILKLRSICYNTIVVASASYLRAARYAKSLQRYPTFFVCGMMLIVNIPLRFVMDSFGHKCFCKPPFADSVMHIYDERVVLVRRIIHAVSEINF